MDKMNGTEFDMKKLEEIVGGATSADCILHGAYTCPFCGQTHTFKFKAIGGVKLTAELVSYSACNLTKSVGMKYMDDIEVHGVNGEYYLVNYKTTGYEF